MNYIVSPSVPVGTPLIRGCWCEAERADRVAEALDGLGSALPEAFCGHLIVLTEEIRVCSCLLREIANRSPLHIDRVQVVSNYLDIILPCLRRSLMDINAYYEDRSVSRETRWRMMYHRMTEEAGGLQLPHRFILYRHFLVVLQQLLTGSAEFDLNTLERLRSQIISLREKRGIPPPVPVAPAVSQELLLMPTGSRRSIHWAKQIFSFPLPSRTALKHLKPSQAYGPFGPLPNVELQGGDSILFRRSFNDDRITLIAFTDVASQSPYFLLRTYSNGNTLYSVRGVHELCINREGSALQLKRWSHSEQRSLLWATLFFLTWEEMVLFHCTFLSLKARNRMTVQISPDEYKLSREKRLFQAQILDDGFRHSLIVYRDAQTHGVRLHAAVWEGELRRCPVWTAFVTHQSQSPTWLSRRSKHRIWLRDVQLYVFCHQYRHESMRQNKAGAFEIYFHSEEGAARFKEVFTVNNTPAPSEANEPNSTSDEQ